ncbi:MAG: C4-type zinc ribbon domain-containing protein [Clostridia bacterium]
MSKLDALWAYQEVELQKAQLESAIRSTPSRLLFNKLHKLLKNQQNTIQKLSDDMNKREQQLAKLMEQLARLNDQVEMENSELATMQQDAETTAEEMTELRGDVEKINREIAIAVREAKTLQGDLEKALEEYQQTCLTGNKAKKEYDQLRVVCEKELAESADKLASYDIEIERLRKTVDAELLDRYEKVKQHHPAPIAKVVNSKCSGCNMSLPMVALKKLYLPDVVIECENCGRILYVAEEK